MIAYKVMRLVNNKLVSLANQKYTAPAIVGQSIAMSGDGVWLSTNKDFVLDNYSGNHDDEVLIQVMYSHYEIKKGNDTDRENVFTVPSCRIMNIAILEY